MKKGLKRIRIFWKWIDFRLDDSKLILLKTLYSLDGKI